jgi:hypothetical protein
MVDSGTATKPAAFTVAYPGIPTITSITPITGYQNSTTGFTITGTNFQPGNTVVTFTNQTTNGVLNSADLTSVTSTKITGNVTIPSTAPAAYYRLDIITADGGVVNRLNAFKVNVFPAPAIGSVAPVAGFRNSTVSYTITGTNFQPGKTTVAFRNQTTGTLLNPTAPDSVTATKIIGNISIPPDIPTGLYNLSVTTIDGGSVSRANAFTATPVPSPLVTSLTPPTGAKNSVVAFTIAGTNFQTDGKTSVRILDDTSSTELATTVYSVTPAKIIGSVTVPASVPSGKYRLEVTTLDGGIISKTDAFTVNYLGLPVIGTLTPVTGARTTSPAFILRGNNFLENGTIVRLRIPGYTINSTITSANATVVMGNFPILFGAPTGPYRLDVITLGGGFSSRLNSFTVM